VRAVDASRQEPALGQPRPEISTGGATARQRGAYLISDYPNTLCRATRHAKTSATTPMKAMAP
jgi:hypothetical protein